jgi:putative DNA primase/helicase
VKDFIKFCLFANDAKYNNKFEEKMVKEMKKIRIELSQHENFKPIYEYKIKNKSPNPYGSFMSDVYTIYETNIIWKAMKFCKGKFIIIVQQYDGFQILIDDTNKAYSLSALIELKEHIKNETGFNIEFTYKSNESEIKMDVVEETKDEVEEEETEVKEEENELKTFEIVSTAFEKKHCKIINKSIFVKECDDGHVILSKAQIKTSYENLVYETLTKKEEKKEKNFINKWLVNNPKQRCYEDIGTFPPPLKTPSNMYNIWHPFAMEHIKEFEKKETELNTVLQHIKILCGNEEHVYDYFIKWIAQMVQYPAIKTVCPTLISKQGAGKGTLMKLFAKMLGNNKVFETTDPSRDVWGAFNGKMCDSFLVNLNELSKKDTVDSAGKIKGLITDEKLSINNKNVNQYEINSYHRFLITTNNLEPVNTSSDDRRNIIIRSSDEKIGNKDYFNNLHSILDDVNVVKTCYEYFKSIEDMDKFNSIPIPQTEHQNNLKQLSITPIEQWLEAFTIEHHKKESVELLGVEACKLFKNWCKSNGINYDIDARKLGVRMKNLKISGIEKGRHTNKGETKKFDINKLKDHFKIGCLIDYDDDDNEQDTDDEEDEV